MSSARHNLSQYDADSIPSAEPLSFGIAVSDWHPEITHALYEGCYDTLIRHGAKPEHIQTLQVPGAFELPVGAHILASQHKLDAVICLGCVVKGETAHNEYINQAVANGLVQMGILTGKPFIFGLLTPDTYEQALDRAGGQYGNKGIEAAVTAIRMASHKHQKKTAKKPIGFGDNRSL